MNYILYMPFVAFFGYPIVRLCLFYLHDNKKDPDIQLLRSFFIFTHLRMKTQVFKPLCVII